AHGGLAPCWGSLGRVTLRILGRPGSVGRVGGRSGVHGASASGRHGVGDLGGVSRVFGVGGKVRAAGARSGGREGSRRLPLGTRRFGRPTGGCPTTRAGRLAPTGLVPTARVAVCFAQDLLRLSLYCSVGRRRSRSEEPQAGQSPLDTCPEAGSLGIR